MHYEIRQHRAVIQRITQMYSDGFEDCEDKNSLTVRARNAALYIFSRRPDIALGAFLKRTSSGGLRFDILRNRVDYVFEISEMGNVSLVTSNSPIDPLKGSLYVKSIHEDFFNKLEEILPDPILNIKLFEIPSYIPFCGIFSGEAITSTGVVLKCIQANENKYVSCGFNSHSFNFDRIALPLPANNNLDADTLLEYMIDMALSGAVNTMVSRDSGFGGILSLHRIDMFPENLCRRLRFKCGYDLLAFQEAWMKVNQSQYFSGRIQEWAPY